jgi:hypothetical protein
VKTSIACDEVLANILLERMSSNVSLSGFLGASLQKSPPYRVDFLTAQVIAVCKNILGSG